MGEKVEGAKKAGDGAVTAVFKIDIHCVGCAEKMKRAVKHLEGVSKAKADPTSNKLTVTGKFDAAAMKSKLEQKFQKKIEIVSPQPKKDGDKKSDEKSEKKKPEEKKSEDKKGKEVTVVLKMRLHCEGCIKKIWKSLIKFKGVNEIKIDAEKDLITVKGAVEGKDVATFLNGKFKRTVDVVVPPKKEEPAAADKKEKDAKAGGAKVEVSKMEYGGGGYYGGAAHAPYGGYYGGAAHVPYGGYYGGAAHAPYSYPANGFANSSGYYTNQMYGNYSHAPQMLSDENTNACSVM